MHYSEVKDQRNGLFCYELKDQRNGWFWVERSKQPDNFSSDHEHGLYLISQEYQKEFQSPQRILPAAC